MLPNDLHKFAQQTAIKAGKYLADNQHRVTVVKNKVLEDFVTNVDFETQKLVLTEIKKAFPDHGIIAEENNIKTIQEYTWIVDPLDGTKYYSKGITEYSTLIALFKNQQPYLGVVYSPSEKSIYQGLVGEGATFNNSPISISKQNNLKKSTIYATLPNISMSSNQFKQTQKGIQKLFSNSYRVRYLASVSLAISWVAHGAFEAFVNIPGDENIWDVAAGFSILASAGGKITDLSGHPIVNFDLSKGIIASNGYIHDELVSLLNSK